MIIVEEARFRASSRDDIPPEYLADIIDATQLAEIMRQQDAPDTQSGN